MFALIDSGTTTTRIYLLDDTKKIVATGRAKIGVRDTSITGSRDKLRNGVSELFFDTLKENNLSKNDVEFAVASGMITSEIGLIELPHLVAPVGINELAEGVVKVVDQNVLPIGCPVYFIRGVRNDYPQPASIKDLFAIDFMRGEETQCMGIISQKRTDKPFNIVAFSSHTKIMAINEKQEIVASKTTISGQIYEALVSSTNIGKSIIECTGEQAGGYTFEEIVNIATEIVHKGGLLRACMAPRFMQVLMQSDSAERISFIDAAIAAEDLGVFREMREQGYTSNYYVFYGHEKRCKLYKYLLEKELGPSVRIEMIFDEEEQARLTIDGAIAIVSTLLHKN